VSHRTNIKCFHSLYVGNNPVNWFDPWGLRVINKSKKIIPVVVNPINPDGTQGKQRIIYLKPGEDTDNVVPGEDTDGIYPPGSTRNPCPEKDKKVLKIVDRTTAVVGQDGKVSITADSFVSRIGQWKRGGFKDEKWIDEAGFPAPWKR
jgi:hypothetical protein